MNGALLIHKHSEISSFGIIEVLQNGLKEAKKLRHRDLPKMGHGGTLDPFATGLLVVLVGRGVKLARYFLGATKQYEGIIKLGETTVPGDPTAPISETSAHIPTHLDEMQSLAHRLTLQPYLQIPPMHSAKKKNGRPLYELARAGIEIEREPKACDLYEFNLSQYEAPKVRFQLKCSSGTYVRTLAQDFGRMCNSVGMLETLHRTQSGTFHNANAWTTTQVIESGKDWDRLPCWIPFDELLKAYPRSEATQEEHQAILQGQQKVIFNLLKRTTPSAYPNSHSKEDCVVIYAENKLIAIVRKVENQWELERVFAPDAGEPS